MPSSYSNKQKEANIVRAPRLKWIEALLGQHSLTGLRTIPELEDVNGLQLVELFASDKSEPLTGYLFIM